MGKETKCCGRSNEKSFDPKNCSPELIKKCHGDNNKHQCGEGKETINCGNRVPR